MPNYFAHLEFGRYVLERLPLPLRREVEREKEAFLLGLYGPDPLMFYHPPVKNRIRAAGREIHRQSARLPAERLRRAVEDGLPCARGYAAGFLCHFALDSACHPYVDALAEGGAATHGQLEAELDRQLMLRVGLDPMRDTPMPPIAVDGALDAVLDAVYPGVGVRRFKSGYDMFCRASRLLTLAAGTPLRGLVERMAREHAGLAGLSGMMLPPEPEPLCVQSSQVLQEKLFAAVPDAARGLDGFFAAPEGAGGPEGWLDRDFHGRSARAGQEEALSPVPAPARC